MPLYDFQCKETSCDKTIEKLVSSSTTFVECPECGGKMERALSGSQSFYFKGEGAYCEKSINKRSPSN